MDAGPQDEGALSLLPVSSVSVFPIGYFLENIAVRPTGQLLVTVHTNSKLIHIDPRSDATPCTVHVFPDGVAGIVEGQPDIYYVNTGTLGEKGSFALQKVDMSPFEADAEGNVKTPAIITKFVDIPDARFLNGSSRLSDGVLLLADSILGTVYSVNLTSGTVKIWLQENVLGKSDGQIMPPGLNGIKIYGGYLYLSNTAAGKLYRVKVSPTGEAEGALEVVAENITIDDFAFDSEGAAYLTTHVHQSVVKLSSDGTRVRIAGGPEDKVVAGTTAVAFGRVEEDSTVLYVTTTGGMTVPVGGEVGPARVLAIDVGVKGA